MSHRFKIGILVGIALIAIIVMCVIPPIPQELSYHSFADKRYIHLIPNFWNVISNFPLIIIGLIGIYQTRNSRPDSCLKEISINCLVFFAGIFLTGIGSAYYHLNPNNNTLIWDRLPMTISFMAFFTIIIGNNICMKSAKNILLPLLILGFISIQYWVITENKGHGDLRFYALIQYLPILLIPIILILYKSNTIKKYYLWGIVITYTLAKVFEVYDETIFTTLGILSGHSIKHGFAALAPSLLLLAMKKQMRLQNLFRNNFLCPRL